MSDGMDKPKQLNLEINGQAVQAEPGSMIIQVADAAGVNIPRFCYHRNLSIAANCRMCLVEVEGVPKPLPACATPVGEGMKVRTDSPFAIAAQKGVMEFLLINHPLDCPICDQGGECELQDLALGYGSDVSRYAERKRVVKDKDIGPLIATDMTRCIHCTRCVRFGDEVAGFRELGATGRGEHTEIGTYVARSVASELSGNVIDLCPVGALTSKPFRFRARAWELIQYDSIAPHDALGSNLHVHVRGNRVMRVVPRENEALNETWISDRDRFSYAGLYTDDRLARPMLRTADGWKELDWESALTRAAEGLQKVLTAHGPEQMGALLSPSATLEELYLASGLMRALGSQNIDHRLRQHDFRGQTAMPASAGLGRSVASLETLDAALLVGSNIRKDLPMVAHRLRKAALQGAALMFVNPLDYDFHFPVAEARIAAPHAMAGELAAVVATLFKTKGKEIPAALQELVGGATVLPGHEVIAQRLLDAKDSAVLLGAYAMQHPDFSVLRSLASAIAGVVGVTVGYLPEGANPIGAWQAGGVPHRDAAGEPVEKSGRDGLSMQQSALKGYLLLGLEPDMDTAHQAETCQSLEKAEFVVALTSHRGSGLERCADLMLPMAAFCETAGTFVNLEGAWQSFQGVTAPYGEARPGWKILRVLANLLGLEGFEQASADEIRDELSALRQRVTEPAASRARASHKLNSPAEGLQRIGDVPIHGVDLLVRRSAPLQASCDGGGARVRISTPQAERLDLVAATEVKVTQEGRTATLALELDDRVPDGCAWIPLAQPESAVLGAGFGRLTLEKA